MERACKAGASLDGGYSDRVVLPIASGTECTCATGGRAARDKMGRGGERAGCGAAMLSCCLISLPQYCAPAQVGRSTLWFHRFGRHCEGSEELDAMLNALGETPEQVAAGKGWRACS